MAIPAVDVKTLFWRKSRFSQNLEMGKKFVPMSEPAQKC